MVRAQVPGQAEVSELRAANKAAGWSSESLVFSATIGEKTDEYVIRIPPAGGGIFPHYDLGIQTLTQELLHEYGIPTPSPILYEPDRDWIGSKFLVMPRIVGHTPSDTTYATRGWLHDSGPDVQRRVHDSFLETLAALQRVPVTSHRSRNAGNNRSNAGGCPDSRTMSNMPASHFCNCRSPALALESLASFRTLASPADETETGL